ncbi:uncharacterized protein YutE (UPF0331/DUF86 family) [Virgibacillus halotolerans]|uniref:DUF86 domain-containing protein n=1 Tax=Virgibacillus halotolerans TaxID=1071053 RepID=UPI0019604FE0|nr:DUF86 domain-containing protein [Virgibacillus halotolerans]MBM7600682.1 uncharacterized protein YutE (UPF0331/DUF86 family) [Virgibacillus halotolerans]
MYFVDRSKIEQTLLYMEEILEEIGRHDFTSFVEKLALERMVHVFIESLFDVGNMMIDGFIMRDPGSYNDIIDILIDEKVLPQADETDYKAVIRLRKTLVTDYITVDHDQLNKQFIGNIAVLKQFSYHIRQYLDNELGVANAFSNESQA